MAGAGMPKTGGRQKGTPNKSSAAVRNAILEAFEKAGGADYLLTLAKSDPKTFCTLLAKVLPLQLTGDDDSPLDIVTRIELVAANPERVATKAQSLTESAF